ncbi:MAG TPA: hypothetical protein PKK69_00500 [Ferruginibacter sp.]|nr:hypothetical protein [Ferruginibacter sp.]
MNDVHLDIDRYLSGEMTDSEKQSFELRLDGDPSLQAATHEHRMLLEAIRQAGRKTDIREAFRKEKQIHRLRTWVIVGLIPIAAMLIIYFSVDRTASVNQAPVWSTTPVQQAEPFIQPVAQKLNVPTTIYYLDATRGDTLVHISGSVLCFPAGSLVDENGQPVTGKATIHYREFSSPLDYYLAGVPMQYDSAGIRFPFESAAMCELTVFANNKPAFVNPAHPPTLQLVSKQSNDNFNLYYLDTVKRNWVFTGKDRVTEMNKRNQSTTVPAETEAILPEKPVRPEKADPGKQHFSIAIEPGSFKELRAYDGLEFELLQNEKFLGTDASEDWQNVTLKPTEQPGIYTVTFYNSRRTVSYRVRPVLGEANYNKALQMFKERSKEYEKALRQRKAAEKSWIDSTLAVNDARNGALRQEQDRINAIIVARNKVTQQIKKQLAMQQEMAALDTMPVSQSTAPIYLANQERIEQLAREYQTKENIYRSFQVNQFGYWNCDRIPNYQPDIQLKPEFVFQTQLSHSPHNIGLAVSGINSLSTINASQPLWVSSQFNQMFFVYDQGLFHYFSFADWQASGINRNTTSFRFRMRTCTEKLDSYEDVRNFVTKLIR